MKMGQRKNVLYMESVMAGWTVGIAPNRLRGFSKEVILKREFRKKNRKKNVNIRLRGNADRTVR